MLEYHIRVYVLQIYDLRNTIQIMVSEFEGYSFKQNLRCSKVVKNQCSGKNMFGFDS